MPTRKIDIYIQKPRPGSKGQGPKKGPLLTDKDDEILKRRGANYINFYDVGQKWNGTFWEDLDFQDVRSLTLSGSPPVPSGTMAFGTTGWDNLKAKVFEVAIDDWKTTYRKLEYDKAEQYYVDLYTGTLGTIFDPYPDTDKRFSAGRAASRNDYFGNASIDGHNWTPKGLKLSAIPTNFFIFSNPLFPGIPTSNVKITGTPVYTDPSVTFNVGKKADVFLMPWPIFNQGSDGSIVTIGLWEGFLNLFFEIMPRSQFIDNAEVASYLTGLFGSPIASIFYEATQPFAGTRHALSQANVPLTAAAVKAWIDARPSARYYYKGTGFISPTAYPTNASLYDINLANFSENNFAGGAVSLEPGALLAVVRTPTQDFYVWQTAHANFAAFGVRVTQ